jgi:hypothetical protein
MLSMIIIQGVNVIILKTWIYHFWSHVYYHFWCPECYNFLCTIEDIIVLWFYCLKGQCHEIFYFCFFRNQFPPAPEYPIRIVSNFFENSRRYSQVKVHRCQWHRWQIATGINDTGGKFAIGINDTGGKFCHQVPLCCWHWWQICHQCQRYRRQFATL